MANKYNVYTPTAYVPLPIDEYRMALGAIDSEAVDKVQQLGAGLASFKGIQGVGADAQAYHKQLLDQINEKVGDISKKNLKSFDAIREVGSIINDPNVLTGMKNVYQDAVEYGKMTEFQKKYREKNPDVNLLPQLSAGYNLSRQQGVAANYKPGMFRNLDSAPDYLDITTKLHGFLKEKKGNAKAWTSSDGRKVYYTEEEALTDPEIRRAANDYLMSDVQARDQMNRNMQYDAFRSSPDNPSAYYDQIAGDTRKSLDENIQYNNSIIDGLTKTLNDKTAKKDILQRKKIESKIENYRNQNKAFEKAKEADPYSLTSQTYLDRHGAFASDIFSYSKTKRTEEWDKLYMLNMQHANRMKEAKYKASLDDQNMSKYFDTPPVVNSGVKIENDALSNPTALENLPASFRAMGLKGDAAKIEFNKPFMQQANLKDLEKRGLITKSDFTSDFDLFQGNAIGGITMSNVVSSLKPAAIKRLKQEHGIEIVDDGYGGFLERKTINQKDVVSNIKREFPGIEKIPVRMSDGTSRTIDLDKIDVNTPEGENDLRTVLTQAARIGYNNQTQFHTTFSPGGIMSAKVAEVINRDIAGDISQKEIRINNKPYLDTKLPEVRDDKGKTMSLQAYLMKENPVPRQVSFDGKTWLMYDLPDGKTGNNKQYMIEGGPQLQGLTQSLALANNGSTTGFVKDTDNKVYYIDKQYIPTADGSYTMGSKAYQMGAPEAINYARNYVTEYMRSNVNSGTVKSAAEHASDALAHLNTLADEIEKNGVAYDPITGKQVQTPLRAFQNPSTGLFDPEYAAYATPRAGVKGNNIGPISGDELNFQKADRYYKEMGINRVPVPEFKRNLMLSSMYGYTPSQDDDDE